MFSFKIHNLAFIKALVLTLVTTTYCYADEDTKHTIEDLPYGVSLFHFFQGKYFSSITDLLVADHYNLIKRNDKNSELLLGSLYLSYGLHLKSSEVFDNILSEEDKLKAVQEQQENESFDFEENDIVNETGNTEQPEVVITPQPIRDRAWFHLGKNHYKHGFVDDALKSFNSVKDTLSDEHESERQFILSNIYSLTEKHDEALEATSNIDSDSLWKSYGLFNVGTGLIKAKRIDEGSKLLQELANSKPTTRESQILKDKAILALAYTALENNQPIEATKLFQTVRLNDNEASKALLGIGWALYKQKEFNQALIPWMELSNRTASDPSVQEALISIPYVFEQINNHNQALHQYDIAINNYNEQFEEINKVVEIINNGSFIERLKLDTLGKESVTPFSILFNINAESNQYLLPLISSNDFHDALKTYQELAYLSYTLDNWENELPALHLILNEKIKTYNTRLKDTIHSPKLKQSKIMQEKRDQLANQIKSIERDDAALDLVKEEEQNNLELIDKLRNKINKLKNNEDLSEEEAKFKLLSGLLQWQIETDFKPRLWEAKKNLKELDQALYKMHGAIYSLSNVWKNAPSKYKGFSAQIKDKKSRIQELKQKMNASLALQEEHLKSMAMKVVNKHRNRLKLFHDRALFAKARIYDSLIVKNDHEKQ